MKRYLPFLFLIVITGCFSPSEPVVTIEKSDERFILKRECIDYFIKGAARMEHLDKLAASGANSVRIWDDYSKNLRLAGLRNLPACAPARWSVSSRTA